MLFNLWHRVVNKKIQFGFLLIIVYTGLFSLLSQRVFIIQNRPDNYHEFNMKSVAMSGNRTERVGNPAPKYILLWTNSSATPFVYFGQGNNIFKSQRCPRFNCFVTSDRAHLGHYTEFEVILFNGPQLNYISSLGDIPAERSSRQKYVYANIEAAGNYPVRNHLWNGFFNWTWTYRLDSDISWSYIVVRNSSDHVIGPSDNIEWIKLSEMNPIDFELENKLKSKTRAVAWFSSNCLTSSQRELMVLEIQKELHRYALQVDVYGACGNLTCPRELMDECLKILERDYYFYFAFENALSADYVTEKLLYSLQSNTVPVVYGGANYSKFMPDGIYLDAMKLGPKALAKKINEIIKSPKRYFDLFRWKNHYSYHFRGESPVTSGYCQLCSMMNTKQKMKALTIYERFQEWWMNNTHII